LFSPDIIDDKIKEGWACIMNGDLKNAHKSLIKSEGRYPLEDLGID